MDKQIQGQVALEHEIGYNKGGSLTNLDNGIKPVANQTFSSDGGMETASALTWVDDSTAVLSKHPNVTIRFAKEGDEEQVDIVLGMVIKSNLVDEAEKEHAV